MRLEKIVTYDCNDECPMYLFVDLGTEKELKFEEDEIVHEKPFECIRRYPLRDISGVWHRYPDSIYWYDLLFPFAETKDEIVHAMGYSLFKSIVHEKPFECIRRYPLREISGDWYRYPDSIYWYDLLFPFAETKNEYDFFKKAIETVEIAEAEKDLKFENEVEI